MLSSRAPKPAVDPDTYLRHHNCYYSGETDRCLLIWLAWRFPSSLRRRLARVGRVGFLGIATFCRSSNRSAILWNAISRLACCDLRSVAVTTIPLGRCSNRTPVSTLLRCCPPGPLAMKKSTSQSRSNDSWSVGYISSVIYSSPLVHLTLSSLLGLAKPALFYRKSQRQQAFHPATS